MNTAAKIERRTDHTGRILYTVAGMLATYVEQEAIDLTQTGVFKVLCPLTQSAVAPMLQDRRATDEPSPMHGAVTKFPWER
jgi:hypothetical protein